MSGRITLLVGTTKGVFLLDADTSREDWTLRGPFAGGWPINHVAGDAETGTFWAAGGSDWHGAGVWRSEDDGNTWDLTKLANGEFDTWITENPDFAARFELSASPPAPFTGQITALWSLCLTDGTLYAGAKPAALFVSTDKGENWTKVQGLSDHPSRDDWDPGAAGLILHSIVSAPDDPSRLWVGISAAGVFATENAGKTWERRNRRSNVDVIEDHPPHPGPQADHAGNDVGLCVHNMVRAPWRDGDGADQLYQQNHHGVFRSSDGGRSWHEITAGLPSNFGFPIAVHPRDPLRLWVLPLNGDSAGRYPPDASAAVWTSCNGGDCWTAQRNGLPQRDCFFTVLRQSMATDRADPVGVYFGTNSGSIFASADEGENWAEIARHLPTVLCVETVQRD